MRSLHITVILLMIFGASCGKDKQPAIPYVFVQEHLYPNSLDYIPVGGYKYVNAGYRGIVIYRSLPDEFKVYERCCPYDPEKPNARIQVTKDNIIAIDSVCMSQYALPYGTPYGTGPSPYSLLTYNYSYDGETLYIFN